jgi:hypothetical protein
MFYPFIKGSMEKFKIGIIYIDNSNYLMIEIGGDCLSQISKCNWPKL